MTQLQYTDKLEYVGVYVLSCAAFFAPLFASAHEVYVLTSNDIAVDTAAPAFDMAAVAQNDLYQFFFWVFVGALIFFAVFFTSISQRLERRLNPLLLRLKSYAAPVARITVGLSFIAAAYYQATYGPELPLAAGFGAWAPFMTALLIAMGLSITLGIFTRIAAAVALGLFVLSVWKHGLYMLTYTNYLGELLILLILGAHHRVGPDMLFGTARSGVSGIRRFFRGLASRFAPYSFMLLRITFGISLLYASLYAKILHNNLALQVASLPLAGHTYPLAYYLGFEPHFLVLGAAIIEIVLAAFFILGIEIRFTSIFLLFWLSLSLWYFGETVWPHIILIGIPIALICAGYDRYSLEGRFFKKKHLEPVL